MKDVYFVKCEIFSLTNIYVYFRKKMDLQKILKEAFPFMNEDKLVSVFNGLNNMLESQFLTVEDIKFLEPPDLNPHLEVFQARKLIGFIKDFTVKEKVTEKPWSSPICPAKHTEKILEPLLINYDRLPRRVMKVLEEQNRPDPTIRRTLVQYVVDNILEKNENPGRKVIQRYAEELIVKFPESLSDKISKSGNVIGNGSYSLLIQLENRISNLKRKKREKKIIEEAADPDNPHKVPNSSHINEYGCRAWQPSMPEGKSLESLEEKQKVLLNIHNLEQSKWNSNEIFSLMADTYYLQRLDINNSIKIADIKLRWPFLLQVNCMTSHFEFLTGIDVIKKLRNFIASESKQMIKYFTSMGNAVPACLKLEREMYRHSTSASQIIRSNRPNFYASYLTEGRHWRHVP